MDKGNNKLIGQILLSKGLITEEQLSDALRWKRAYPNEGLANILQSRGLINESQILEAYAEKLSTTFIEKDLVIKRPEVLKLVPENIALRHTIMPLETKGAKKLVIATSKPRDVIAVEDVKISSKMDVELVFATEKNILSSIDRYYKNVELFYNDKANEPKINIVSADTAKKIDEIESNVLNTPVVKLVNNLVQQAYVRKASDIHIEPFEHEVVVRMRIDGDLVESMRVNISALNSIISRIKILSGMNIAEKRIPQDGRFNFILDDLKVDLRVSTIPTIYGEKCVMRLLNTGGQQLLGFEQLGMSRETIEKFEKICSAPNGIVLVTGPTGSGKSTTLYAVLNRLNLPTVNITTIEDPVERQLFGVNQVQVNPKAGLTFASGLRSLLRQDPDVIMVGEIRDYETAEIATRAAITGHLVLSTLHTNDSIATIARLIDMGIPAYLVSASVNAIIAQRLVKRLCINCRKKRQATPNDRLIVEDQDLFEVYEPNGCPDCNQTGYAGRIAIYEIVELTHKIKAMITNDDGPDVIKAEAIKNGAEFLSDNLKILVKSGITSISEYERLVYSV